MTRPKIFLVLRFFLPLSILFILQESTLFYLKENQRVWLDSDTTLAAKFI
jgi:hypothetical protein